MNIKLPDSYFNERINVDSNCNYAGSEKLHKFNIVETWSNYVTISNVSDIGRSIIAAHENNPNYRLVGTSRTTVMFERVTHDCNTGSQ